MPALKTYSEMATLGSLFERYKYLALRGVVGRETFGFDRYMNQQFYTSSQWKQVRKQVIARDFGCDLGVRGFEIYDKVVIHHMNPMTVDDIVHGNADILTPEYLVSTSPRTHSAIHFSDESLLPKILTARSAGDTKLW